MKSGADTWFGLTDFVLLRVCRHLIKHTLTPFEEECNLPVLFSNAIGSVPDCWTRSKSYVTFTSKCTFLNGSPDNLSDTFNQATASFWLFVIQLKLWINCLRLVPGTTRRQLFAWNSPVAALHLPAHPVFCNMPKLICASDSWDKVNCEAPLMSLLIVNNGFELPAHCCSKRNEKCLKERKKKVQNDKHMEWSCCGEFRATMKIIQAISDSEGTGKNSQTRENYMVFFSRSLNKSGLSELLLLPWSQ